MNTYSNEIFKRLGREESREEGCIIVTNSIENVLLNPTICVVWDYIDGYLPVHAIYNNMIEKYGDENTSEYIQEILSESINILLEHKLIEKIN